MDSTDLPHHAVLTRLGPSAIHGVGVFAISVIGAGTQLFVHDDDEIRWIEASAVDAVGLDEARRALYRDFAIRRDGYLGCPASFDKLTPGWYLNQPLTGISPNVRATEDFRMIAVRDIAEGEELTLDYEAFNCGPTWS